MPLKLRQSGKYTRLYIDEIVPTDELDKRMAEISEQVRTWQSGIKQGYNAQQLDMIQQFKEQLRLTAVRYANRNDLIDTNTYRIAKSQLVKAFGEEEAETILDSMMDDIYGKERDTWPSPDSVEVPKQSIS